MTSRQATRPFVHTESSGTNGPTNAAADASPANRDAVPSKPPRNKYATRKKPTLAAANNIEAKNETVISPIELVSSYHLGYTEGNSLNRLMPPIPVNYVAVLVAAVAGMAVGFAWYGPIFGKAWIKLMKFTDADMKKAQAQGMNRTYALAFIGSLIMAYVLSHSLIFASAYLNVTGISAGLQAAFWNWLGYIFPVALNGFLWEGRPWKLFLLNAGHYLAVLGVMGAILSLWP